MKWTLYKIHETDYGGTIHYGGNKSLSFRLWILYGRQRPKAQNRRIVSTVRQHMFAKVRGLSLHLRSCALDSSYILACDILDKILHLVICNKTIFTNCSRALTLAVVGSLPNVGERFPINNEPWDGSYSPQHGRSGVLLTTAAVYSPLRSPVLIGASASALGLLDLAPGEVNHVMRWSLM